MMHILRKAVRRFTRIIQKIRIVYYAILSSDVDIQGKMKRNQPVLIVGKGAIIIKGQASVGFFPSPFFFNGYAHFDLRKENARVEIGNGVKFNNNPTLIADGATISIGEDSLIGLNFTVLTSDAHGLEPDKRMSSDYSTENVAIGRNVFIGNNVTLLKGVTIGNNSVIGNGSIVVSDIPEGVVAAGVPCKVIRNL